MGEFNYKAKNQRGVIRSGTIYASSKSTAKQKLKKMRLKPVQISQVASASAPDNDDILGGLLFKDDKGNWQVGGASKPKPKDLVVFTKQFSTLLNSGVPMVKGLSVLGEQQHNRLFGKEILRIRNEVEEGASLSDAMESGSAGIFDTLFVAMVRAGEASGNIDAILKKLVIYIEKSAKIKAQIKSASFYPATVMVVAFLVIGGLLAFVVPSFAENYKQSGNELPQLTQFVIDISDFLLGRWYLFIGGLIALFVLFKLWTKNPKGKMSWHSFLLKAPLVGVLNQKIAVARFCSTMASMLQSGVNMLEALTICAQTSGNLKIEKFVLGVRESLENGSTFAEPLSEGDLFPEMVVSMVSVGESSGALDEMLEKVSEFYEDEVDLAVAAMLSMIEPLLIVFIGSVVAFIVVAMYLPIFGMADNFG